MAYECRVERDSVSPSGIRLTTLVATYPRIIHGEVMTHRVLSRNSASSRAIPVSKRIAAVDADPFVPEVFGANQKGMQAGGAVAYQDECRVAWLQARDAAVCHARTLDAYGVHKQLANRLLEPFSWHTTIITATDWANFFALRCHPAAQPELQKIACMMRDAMAASTPEPILYGDWHLPFIPSAQRDRWSMGEQVIGELKLISAGRCARVSYLSHSGCEDRAADVALARRLIDATPKHSSPLEHVATPTEAGDVVRGNFRGWRQFRHEIQGESIHG